MSCRKRGSRSCGTNDPTRTVPDVGCSRPASTLSVVVFPAPFGPRKPTRSPSAIWNDSSSTALTSSYLRRSTERSAAAMPGARLWTR